MEESNPLEMTLEEIEILLQKEDRTELIDRINRVHPADVANLLDELETEDAVALFRLLTIEQASEVLDETGSEVREELVEQIDDERLADIIETLPMDDAAEFLYDLPTPVSDRLLQLMEPEEAAEVQELLSYEDETAGRLMNRDVAVLQRDWTVNRTLEYLREQVNAETLHHLYVVDLDEKLIGVVPLRTLIMSSPDALVENIMIGDVFSVPLTADQEELAELVSRYDYFAMPVVDDEGKLLGVVTVDDVLDVLEEEVTEDIQRLGGSEPLDQPYFAASLGKVIQKRIGWLLLLFAASIFTAQVVQGFQDTLAAVVALSFFMPLVTGTGGNAGSQTVATIIRAITLDEVKMSNLGRAWRREFATAATLGVVMGVCGYGVALMLTGETRIAWVVSITLPLVVAWAVTVATLVPILADTFNIDPTVISGPLITTVVDASALLIYFFLAGLLLSL